MKRSSGILMHVSSLAGPEAIGTFGEEAFRFIDFLKAAGQTYWQILPLGSTGYGDSPYQSFSAFDGNPYLISLSELVSNGLLECSDLTSVSGDESPEKVSYGLIMESKIGLLKKAFSAAGNKEKKAARNFADKNAHWIDDYSLFMALKYHFNLRPWKEWDEKIRMRSKKAVAQYRKELKDEIDFWVFVQSVFFRQWKKVRKYAIENGVQIIGDIPVYVAEDSADVWSHPELFYLDENKTPIEVSGCPPDSFSATGQLWGNPIYNWKFLKKTGYKWWIERIRANLKLYDVIRIDHFRGFEAYWQIPYGDPTAEFGEWIKGPGLDVFKAIEKALGSVDFIAEDLGFLTPEVHKMRDKSGYPGMKVLQFAFDIREESDYLPHNYNKNCIVYTGTHDNDTVMGWMDTSGSKADVAQAAKYLKLTREEGYHWGFIRGAWSSTAVVAVAQMQDFLGLGSEARMNIPSTIGDNWEWRIKPDTLSGILADKIKAMTQLYGRYHSNDS